MYVCLYCPSVLVTQSCSTFWDPMDCSPPGSSVHVILQERILRWITILFSRGSSWPRDWNQVSYIAGRHYHPSHQYCPKWYGKLSDGFEQQVSQVALVEKKRKEKKNPPANAGDKTYSNILAWRSPMNRGAWGSTIYGVAQSWTCLST